jgi:DNA (cytosine-5)-methyltransferase 1
MNFKIIDIFSGCGGLSIGLQQAGFKLHYACDSNKWAAETFRSAHPGANFIEGDADELLKKVTADNNIKKSLKEADLVVGGPPCQGFSGWNRYRNAKDKRNSLVDTFFGFVQVLKPKIVIMENVTGILSLNNGSSIKKLIKGLRADMGYTTSLHIVQAGCYGIPQNRWRIILIASKKGIPHPHGPRPLHIFPRTVPFNTTKHRDSIIKPPSEKIPLFEEYAPYVTVRDAIGDLPPIENGESYKGNFKPQKKSAYLRLLGSNGNVINDHATVNLQELNMKRITSLKYGQSWVDLPNDLMPRNLAKTPKSYDNRFGRLKWDSIFNTIVTKVEPYWGRVIHPEQDRLISARESARAQGFGDDISFHGPLREKYVQIGNAVPPPLGRAIGWEIRKALGDKTVGLEIDEYKNQYKK